MNQQAELQALRGSVARHEQEFRRALSGFGAVARETVDPLHWFHAHPLGFVFAALALGWWLGSRAPYART
jgi:hypothetical protein